MMKENEKADDCFDPSLSACTWIRVSSLTVGYKPTTTRSAAKQKENFLLSARCEIPAKSKRDGGALFDDSRAIERGVECLVMAIRVRKRDIDEPALGLKKRGGGKSFHRKTRLR